MSAFTPYQRSLGDQVNSPLTSSVVIPQVPGVNDLRTMLQMYTAAVYSFGLRSSAPVSPKEEPVEKGSGFLMKNILSVEEKKSSDEDAEASRLEVVASGLGKSEAGHRCIYCGKMYSRKYGLKIHIRTHTGYKPLKCRICFRPFGDPSNLNKHVRLHSQAVTPYQCKLCSKILVRKRDLDRHMLSQHKYHRPDNPRENDIKEELHQSVRDGGSSPT